MVAVEAEKQCGDQRRKMPLVELRSCVVSRQAFRVGCAEGAEVADATKLRALEGVMVMRSVLEQVATRWMAALIAYEFAGFSVGKGNARHSTRWTFFIHFSFRRSLVYGRVGFGRTIVRIRMKCMMRSCLGWVQRFGQDCMWVWCQNTNRMDTLVNKALRRL